MIGLAEAIISLMIVLAQLLLELLKYWSSQ